MEPLQHQWKGRTALITGATAGIGRQVCEQLIGYGIPVVGIGRRKEKLDELASSLREINGRAAEDLFLGISTDIRSEQAIKQAMKQINEWNGNKGVDILVNSAGVGYSAKLIDGDTESWREMWETNVLALSILTREVIQDMKRRNVDDGIIIHLSSMAAHRPIALSFYSATKAAVKMLGDCLRQELREAHSNIRVAMVSPGHVETEFYVHVGGEEFANNLYRSMKCLEPKDIADSIVYILSCPSLVDIHDIWMRPRDMKF
ncbi:Dehydrogenase/reductase SDR family member 11 [Galdieria sulphuraria]|nr:Dehydrogenase/reductase SDR family member 11 [Galdieria sulphuraria]